MRFRLFLLAIVLAAPVALHAHRPRERDLKFPIGGTAGPLDTITDVAGVWRGESLCASIGTACVNETVVYYISTSDHSGFMSIRADKVVDGRAVTMGTSDWRYDADHRTLVWDTPRQTWWMKVDGDTITGTLTLADHTLVRRMTLKRSASRE